MKLVCWRCHGTDLHPQDVEGVYRCADPTCQAITVKRYPPDFVPADLSQTAPRAKA